MIEKCKFKTIGKWSDISEIIIPENLFILRLTFVNMLSIIDEELCLVSILVGRLIRWIQPSEIIVSKKVLAILLVFTCTRSILKSPQIIITYKI